MGPKTLKQEEYIPLHQSELNQWIFITILLLIYDSVSVNVLYFLHYDPKWYSCNVLSNLCWKTINCCSENKWKWKWKKCISDFRFQILDFRISYFVFQIFDFGFQISYFRWFQILNFRYRILGFGFQTVFKFHKPGGR